MIGSSLGSHSAHPSVLVKSGNAWLATTSDCANAWMSNWVKWVWFVAGDAFSVISGRDRRSVSTDILLSMDPVSFDDEV